MSCGRCRGDERKRTVHRADGVGEVDDRVLKRNGRGELEVGHGCAGRRRTLAGEYERGRERVRTPEPDGLVLYPDGFEGENALLDVSRPVHLRPLPPPLRDLDYDVPRRRDMSRDGVEEGVAGLEVEFDGFGLFCAEG